MNNPTIKSWAEDDRPREKLQMKGERSLSNAELLAILLGSGNTDESAVELAKKILLSTGNDLGKAAKLSLKELMFFKGIGPAKAVTIKAALELGKRRQMAIKPKTKQVSSSTDAYELIAPYLLDKKVEEFWVLLFNRRNHMIDQKMISLGGVSSTVVDAKVVFKYAIDQLASGLILVHNHPSGNKKPGQSDIGLTKKLAEASKLLDIDLLDHLILTDHDYFSFRDEGML